jgi:tripartite-type tricarboxylate transporter receptor subunit TctC
MNRRTFSIGASSALITAPGLALGQSGVITVIVPFPPGGVADVIGRLVAERMAEIMKRPFVVSNKPGAAGFIGTKMVMDANPDGTTLLLQAQGHVTLPKTLAVAKFDAVGDFEPVARLATSPFCFMINGAIPATTLGEFYAWARKQSHPILFATAGPGGIFPTVAELITKSQGFKIEPVPYKGSSEMVLALQTGQVQATLTPSTAQFDDSRKKNLIRYVAVTDGDRSPLYPDLPSWKETDPTMIAMDQWTALFATKGTPLSTVERLSKAAGEALGDPRLIANLRGNSYLPAYQDATAFREYLIKYKAIWDEALKNVVPS